MKRLLLATLALVSASCISYGRNGLAPLSEDERAIVVALLEHEARSFSFHSDRPILVLSSTNNWMPLENEDPRPDDIPPDVWATFRQPVSPELRQANTVLYSLRSLPLSARLISYDASEFQAIWQSESRFASLARRLGGKEPLVLSVSRPSLSLDRSSATVLVHVLSTWSGCGGVNEFHLTRSEGVWQPELHRVIVFW